MSKKMENPFEKIDARLSNLENITLSISHRLPETGSGYDNVRNLPLNEMDIPWRIFNACKAREIKDSDQLAKHGVYRILKWRNCGPKIAFQIVEVLIKMGYGKDIVF